MAMDSHDYEVNIRWSHNRQGMMCAPDIPTQTGEKGCIEVATPPQFNKGIGGIWSPEHLFTAAVGSCLMTTFLAVAESSKLEFKAFNCVSKGRLERIAGKYLMTTVMLEPLVAIVNEQDRERVLKILQKAEAACLISNSIKSKVIMKPKIEVVSETLA